jgi:hypothetical protein
MLTSGLVLCVLAGVAGDGAPSVLQVAERAGFSLTQADAQAGERGMVRVHIESDHPAVELQRIGGTAYGASVAVLYQSVCNTPCDQVIDARAGSFVLGGPDVPFSSQFQLSQYSGDLTLHVKAGNMGQRLLGVTGLTLGVMAACASVVGFIVAATLSPTRQARGEHVVPLMIGAIGAGVTVVFGGGGLWLTSVSGTEYRIVPGPASSQPGRSPRDVSI